jgi:hypothetical protein
MKRGVLLIVALLVEPDPFTPASIQVASDLGCDLDR